MEPPRDTWITGISLTGPLTLCSRLIFPQHTRMKTQLQPPPLLWNLIPKGEAKYNFWVWGSKESQFPERMKLHSSFIWKCPGCWLMLFFVLFVCLFSPSHQIKPISLSHLFNIDSKKPDLLWPWSWNSLSTKYPKAFQLESKWKQILNYITNVSSKHWVDVCNRKVAIPAAILHLFPMNEHLPE